MIYQVIYVKHVLNLGQMIKSSLQFDFVEKLIAAAKDS